MMVGQVGSHPVILLILCLLSLTQFEEANQAKIIIVSVLFAPLTVFFSPLLLTWDGDGAMVLL